MLLQKVTRKYTSGESTSISYESANQLMEGILYCINEYDSSNISEVAAPDLTLESVYEEGYRLVVKKTKEARKIQESLMLDFRSFGNEAYEDTVIKGMQQFFLYYDARFRPMDHLLTLDYPTLGNYSDLKGIDLIYEYLTNIVIEQQFLRKIPEEYVWAVLSAYSQYHEKLVINIPAVVIDNLIGAMILEKSPSDYGYSLIQYEKIYELLRKEDSKYEFLMVQLRKILSQLDLLDKRVEQYFMTEVDELSTRINVALEYQHIERIFQL
ncbi:hypothetical protein lbkm_0939 [Lachnospiraceae bacterium KM106-2]|nr:hypothetical protein lbkm_0939 [Lachnospiraceae bacterium KM106-2]